MSSEDAWANNLLNKYLESQECPDDDQIRDICDREFSKGETLLTDRELEAIVLPIFEKADFEDVSGKAVDRVRLFRRYFKHLKKTFPQLSWERILEDFNNFRKSLEQDFMATTSQMRNFIAEEQEMEPQTCPNCRHETYSVSANGTKALCSVCGYDKLLPWTREQVVATADASKLAELLGQFAAGGMDVNLYFHAKGLVHLGITKETSPAEDPQVIFHGACQRAEVAKTLLQVFMNLNQGEKNA